MLLRNGTGYVIEIPFLSRLEEYGDMPHTVFGWRLDATVRR